MPRLRDLTGQRFGQGLTLERIDNNGPYSPENCRWATPAEQSRNTRRNRLVTIGTETRCLTDWSVLLDVPFYTLDYRAKRWERAMSA